MKKYIHLLILLTLPKGESTFLSHDLLGQIKNTTKGKAVRLKAGGGHSLPYFYHKSVTKNWNSRGLTPRISLDDYYLNGYFGSLHWLIWGFMEGMVEQNSKKINTGLLVLWREQFCFLGKRIDGEKCGFTTSMRFLFGFAPFEPRRYVKKK